MKTIVSDALDKVKAIRLHEPVLAIQRVFRGYRSRKATKKLRMLMDEGVAFLKQNSPEHNPPHKSWWNVIIAQTKNTDALPILVQLKDQCQGMTDHFDSVGFKHVIVTHCHSAFSQIDAEVSTARQAHRIMDDHVISLTDLNSSVEKARAVHMSGGVFEEVESRRDVLKEQKAASNKLIKGLEQGTE